jgi:xylulokinase
MSIGGLDVGSTGSKITIFSEDGIMLHQAYHSYPVSRELDTHEINAADIWEAVRTLIADAVKVTPNLHAVGIATFGESFVLLDKDDKILLPTMMYTDPRGAEEAEELVDRFGILMMQNITGVNPHSMYGLPKLMWVKKHHPEVWGTIKYVLEIEDFLVYMLTGNRIVDYSLATRLMAFDIHMLCWSRELLDFAGIPTEWLSSPVPTGTDAGIVKPNIAETLGLPKNLHIVACCQDQIAAAVGAGVLTEGQATDGTGTVECITPVFTHIPENGGLQRNNYAIVPFLRPETYCCYAFTYTGGALVKWFIDNLAGYEKRAAADKGISIYDELESQSVNTPTGILVLPHFAGAATPYMDSGAKGAMVGMTLETTAADIYCAVQEGIAYEMALNLKLLQQTGMPIDKLHATGGCAKSAKWLQMKADILNVPLMRMGVDEAGTVGGIMLTGVATGAYQSLEAAMAVLVKPLETFYPRPEKHAAYLPYFERYKQLYAALRPLV